jgi:hypothetical protein
MKFLCTALAATVIACTACLGAAIPSVRIANITYSNVVVLEVSTSSVSISHSRGMASFNARRLAQDELEQLRLVDPPPKPVAQEPARPRRVAVPAASSGATNDSQLAIARAIDVAARAQPFNMEQVVSFLWYLPPITWGDIGIGAAAYVVFCVCAALICFKAGRPAPLLVWLPFIQIFALYRAAKMSPVWFGLLLFDLLIRLGLFAVTSTRYVPERLILIFGFSFLGLAVIHGVGAILWCFKICRARGKSPLLGVSMFMPGVNVLTFLFLAFSRGPDVKVATAKL